MVKKTRKDLEEFLVYLITPQDEQEKELFKKHNLVDEYIRVNNSIPDMSLQELIDEINRQLHPFGLEIEEDI